MRTHQVASTDTLKPLRASGVRRASEVREATSDTVPRRRRAVAIVSGVPSVEIVRRRAGAGDKSNSSVCVALSYASDVRGAHSMLAMLVACGQHKLN